MASAKGKAPADQFYYADYIRDTRGLTLTARGAWMDFLCFAWWANPMGQLTKTIEEWALLWGCTVEVASRAIDEIKAQKVGNVTVRNNEITIMSRRQVKKRKEREANKIRQKRHRARVSQKSNGGNNAAVIPYSSTSTSTSSFSDEKDSRASPPQREWKYPLKEYFDLLGDLGREFPDLLTAPATSAQLGMIEAVVEDDSLSHAAWKETMDAYRGNCNPALKIYDPRKIKNVLDTFYGKRRDLEQRQRGAKSGKPVEPGKSHLPPPTAEELEEMDQATRTARIQSAVEWISLQLTTDPDYISSGRAVDRGWLPEDIKQEVLGEF